jgi:hypothetical protein
MNWAGKQHPIETLAEWVAPALLAAAAGWAVWLAMLPVTTIVVAAAAAFAAGLVAMRVAGNGNAEAASRFEPAELEPVSPASELDELLLGPADAVLILDDPLIEVASDSRVVRLFARQDPTPGELVDRIADFLGDGRGAPPLVDAPAEAMHPADASTALHAALANIRASLR